MKKQSWKEYLHFSRKERNALVIICTVTLATVIVPYIMPARQQSVSIDTNLQHQLDAISKTPDSSNSLAQGTSPVYQRTPPQDNAPAVHAELFVFDPNTLDEAGWKRLGLREKTVKTILNYRSKGGRFKRAEDLAKVYGLHSEDAARLIPYVRIETLLPQNTKADTKPSPPEEIKAIPQPSFPRKQYKPLNINTATEEEWKTMPGIGDVLAGRIVNFRTKIGGFKSIEQVGKTYGLKDSLFQEMKPYLKLE